MNRRIPLLLSVFVGALGFAVAGAAFAQAPIQLRWGHYLADGPFVQLEKEFASKIEKRTKGRVKINMTFAGGLGKGSELLLLVGRGGVDMSSTPPGYNPDQLRYWRAFQIPFVFKSSEQAMDVLYKVVEEFPAYRAEMDKLGVVWLFQQPLGVYYMTGPSPDCASVDRLRGKKIRAFPSPIEKETFAVFGASLAPMDLSEVIPALQAGVIDGSKSGMVVFAPFKYQGAAKNAIRSSETLICPPIIASKVWFDKLPGDMQKIVLDASKTADQKAMEFSIGFNEQAYADWKAGGGELYLLSKAERAEMMKMLEGVGPAALKGDAESLGMYELIKRVAARTRGKTG